MNRFEGQALSWELKTGVIELTLHRPPCNELGLLSLKELEGFASAFEGRMQHEACVLFISSDLQSRLCAGADLRELYERSQAVGKTEGLRGVRDFLERIHR